MAQINLGGSIGTTGTSILGSASVIFATNANHTLTVAEYSNQYLACTSSVSLTATRDLIAPLTAGVSFIINNATTGSQAIRIIGATGTGVTIANGSIIQVITDGVNYSTMTGTTTTFSGDLSGTNTSQSVIKINGNAVSSTLNNVLQDGYVLTWVNSASEYEAKPAAISFTAGGDLTGTNTNQSVIKINGNAVNSAVNGISQDGYVLTWVNSTLEYKPKPAAISFTAGGDLTGTNTNQSVTKINGNPVSSSVNSALQDGYVLTWVNSASEYEPKQPATGFTAGGDLSGTSTSQTVTGIYSRPVAITTPIAGAALVYSVTNSRYDVRRLTFDDVDAAFAISSFSGGSNVEIGATVTDPIFSASYSSLPTSAQITNSDSIDSPRVLTTPFTGGNPSGKVTGAFTKSTLTFPATSVVITFTLTAIAATTKTSNSNISFFARSFVGVGTAGATSATASGTTAILVGATGTLASHNLSSSVIGSTTATQNPTNQRIYFLCLHTSTLHTFKDGANFSFPMGLIVNGTPSGLPTTFNFTNINGSVLSMDLYESTYPLSTPFALTVLT